MDTYLEANIAKNGRTAGDNLLDTMDRVGMTPEEEIVYLKAAQKKIRFAIAAAEQMVIDHNQD